MDPREVALRGLLPAWRRRDFDGGRAVVRAALERVLGVLPEGFALVRGEGGAPVPVVGGRRAPWAVSLSHRGEVTVAAVRRCGCPVGVDVEVADPGNEVLRGVLGRGDRVDEGLDATLLLAAKEAAYKACAGAWAGLCAYRVTPVAAGSGSASGSGSGSGELRIRPDRRAGVPRLLQAWTYRAGDFVVVVTGPGLARPELVACGRELLLRPAGR
ncbi:hypothetical protein G5C51_41765 [Streptomyces sp. A7024]|uniref:Phosphopantetheinyl transferase n=1 Tax=Streptomyces coryli TaxID=1128680 RepID=A0A6G4UER9_9ACTN|nr:hypothetical protein [Streptomyces coryli]NGN70396.1 hypothetical protein [Streptomyces coryli]